MVPRPPNYIIIPRNVGDFIIILQAMFDNDKYASLLSARQFPGDHAAKIENYLINTQVVWTSSGYRYQDSIFIYAELRMLSPGFRSPLKTEKPGYQRVVAPGFFENIHVIFFPPRSRHAFFIYPNKSL